MMEIYYFYIEDVSRLNITWLEFFLFSVKGNLFSIVEAISTAEVCTYIKERQRSLIAHLAGAGVAVSPPAAMVVS